MKNVLRLVVLGVSLLSGVSAYADRNISGTWYAGDGTQFQISAFGQNLQVRYSVYNASGTGVFEGSFRQVSHGHRPIYSGRLHATQYYHNGQSCSLVYSSRIEFISFRQAVQNVTGSNGACGVSPHMGWTTYLSR
jgi:hypothetical protein